MSQPSGRIYTGADVASDTTVTCDVCIIGSGAGGAMLASELCLAGLDVVLLEEGGHRTRRDFDLREETAYPAMYQEMGGRGTEDRSIQILQARTVGGGTTVNWCTSFRTPSRILAHWRERYGLTQLTDEALAPHFDWVEKRLNIHEWPLEQVNRNNRILWDGLGALGYSRGLIRRNVRRCADIGYCGMGCPIDAKRSALVTLLPDAVEQGLRLYANAPVRRLGWEGRAVRTVEAELLDPETQRPRGVRLTVRPRTVAVCGGALNSPALLLRSGLTGEGLVGKRTFLHPVVASMAIFDEPVEPYRGAPQSVYSHHFVERGDKMGFFLEVPPLHPLLAANAGSTWGEKQAEGMAQLPNLQGTIALTVDGLDPSEEGGTVTVGPGGRMRFQYSLTERNWEVFRAAQREMARIQFAAGARRVLTLHSPPVELGSVRDLPLLERAPWERLRVRILTAHQLGGCAMGGPAVPGVLDEGFRYRWLDNLFVVDGSVFPTSLGVNPAESILALARYAAPFVAAARPGS